VAALRIYRRLQDLQDVDPNGLPNSGVPVYQTAVSSFVVQTIAGGAGGSFSLGASNLGNTLGDTGVTGTRVVLAGIGNITLSQLTDANGGTISISGAGGAQSVQTQDRFNLTLSGNTAGVLQQVSSGTLTLAGGNNVTLSQNGNAVTISGAAQSVQPETQTFLGGVSASDTVYTSGTVNIVGSGDITVLSGTGQRVIISGSQSVQPETQTFVAGIAGSNTTYTSGTVRITGVGGGVTVSSNTGQRIDISVAAPVAQTGTQFSAGLSNLGNTGGDTGTVAGRLVLVGSNNITLSGSTNGVSETISIFGQSGGGAGFSAGVSGGNTSGDTGATGTRVVFAGGNNITLSQSTNANGGSITVSAPQTSVLSAVAPLSTSTNGQTISILGPPSFSAGVSTVGNTLGDTGITGSRLVIAGINNITVSQSTNASGGTVTISGANVGGAQTGISGIANSQTTYTSGTVSLSELGAITIRSTTGNQFQFSVNAQSAESQSFGMSNIGNTSGTTGIASGAQVRFLLAGGNNVTLSQSLNGASGTITISAFNQSVQSLGMYALGNTTGQSSSTTMDARTLSIRGDGIVSVGYSNGSLRISASQSVQPETQTFLGGIAASDKTYTSGTVVLTGAGGGITVQSNAGQTITLSVAAPVAQTNQTLGMYAVQNTTGQSSSTTMDARTISVAGDGAASVGYSAGSLRISVPLQTVESQSIGMSNVGNTSGTTGMASGGQVRFVFAGGNNITLSQSLNGASGTITISAPNLGAGAMSAGASNLGNTAGATGITGTQLVLVGTNAISLSQTTGANGGTLSIDAPVTSSLVGTSGISISTNGSTISVMQTTGSSILSSWQAFEGPMANGFQGQGSVHFAPYRVPDLQHDRALVGLQISNATNSSNSITLSAHVGIYSRNGSSISLISSTSGSTNFSGSGTVGSYSLYGGMRYMSIPWTNTLTEGDYWIGMLVRTTTGGGAGHTINQLVRSEFTAATITGWSGLMGAAATATAQLRLGLGVWSVTSSSVPGSAAFSHITGSGSMGIREPYLQLRSGTV
jgi:fibronectin-binding autotransporter adhesin